MAQGLAGFGVGDRSQAALATTTTSRAFWQAVDRLQVRDGDALELISCPGKIELSRKRSRFPPTTHQTRLAGYLPEIEAALENAGLTPAWLLRGNRAAPFSGRSPIKLMAERDGEGAAEVLQYLRHAVLRRSLG
jgi:hypothetical protein